jgi:hypothetical protein
MLAATLPVILPVVCPPLRATIALQIPFSEWQDIHTFPFGVHEVFWLKQDGGGLRNGTEKHLRKCHLQSLSFHGE